MANAKKTSRKPPALSSRKANGPVGQAIARENRKAPSKQMVDWAMRAVALRRDRQTWTCAQLATHLRMIDGSVEETATHLEAANRLDALDGGWGRPRTVPPIERPKVGKVALTVHDNPPTSPEARKRAMRGELTPEYDFSHGERGKYARLAGREVAKMLGATPAGKAPKRAAAHAAHTPPRKARR
jgi:hypothetical protein